MQVIGVVGHPRVLISLERRRVLSLEPIDLQNLFNYSVLAELKTDFSLLVVTSKSVTRVATDPARGIHWPSVLIAPRTSKVLVGSGKHYVSQSLLRAGLSAPAAVSWIRYCSRYLASDLSVWSHQTLSKDVKPLGFLRSLRAVWGAWWCSHASSRLRAAR